MADENAANVQELAELANFDEWHQKINEIINALSKGEAIERLLSQYLKDALEGNQISPYLPSPGDSLTYPDPTQSDGQNSSLNGFTYNWNDYSRNGVFYIPWVAGITHNEPMNRSKSGVCYVASVSALGPAIQIGLTMENPSVLAIRYGKEGTSAPIWSAWMEWPNKAYLDTNFLNKTTPTAQEVAADTLFHQKLTAAGELSAKSNASLAALTVFGSNGKRIVVNPKDSSANSSTPSTGRYCTVEVAPAASTAPITEANSPLWDSSNGQPVSAGRRSAYIEPIWIDKEERTAHINGTAQYAYFIVPENMISRFKSWEIVSTDLWKPVTAKALKDFFDWTRETYMPLAGGVFTGIVRHNQDIFLDHLAGAQENRTAAIRSVVRPLNLQCQGSTHLISNSKQSCLYLEKEDADSAEFTVEHQDIDIVFRQVYLDSARHMDADRNFRIDNPDSPVADGYWNCHLTNGQLLVRMNGQWKFTAYQEALNSLVPGEQMKVRIFYRVVNPQTQEDIASSCEHVVTYARGDDPVKEGVLDINDKHWQIVVTDTDWEGLPVVKKSVLAAGSKLVDGSFVAAGSVINGREKNASYAVYGLEVAYGLKGDSGTEPTDGLLAAGSIIRKGSWMTVDSVLNGMRCTNTKYVETDIRLSEDGLLKPGFVLKSGSSIKAGSVLNGYQYTGTTAVSGQDISENSTLEPSSKILLGSLISTESSLNGIPGKTTYMEVQYGATPDDPFAELAAGTVLLEGTVIAKGSEINETSYEESSLLSERIRVQGRGLLISGSRIAAGSVIEANSVINGKRWISAMKASGLDAIIPLTEKDLAPIIYFRTYDHIQKRWASGWIKQSFSTVYPNVEEYDGDLWYNWIVKQLNDIEIQDNERRIIIADIEKSLNKEERTYSYPLAENLNTLLESGCYLLNEENKSHYAVPNNVFDSRCYVFSHTRTLGLDRIIVQPYKVAPNEAGVQVPTHDPVLIFDRGNVLMQSFIGEAFRYFNFNVVQQTDGIYSVHYDIQLVPEQKNLNVDVASERLVFRMYSDTINTSGEVGSTEKISSINVAEMFGAPFVYGARTRTGITSEGQLGDTLYDLGGIEISEDALELKIRKRSLNDLTPIADIKDTIAMVLERRAKDAATNSWVERMCFRPSATGILDLGASDMRFRNVYYSGDPITSSDRNIKAEISDIPESLLKKWAKVKWVSFKFKDSIEAKGQRARIHSGVVAQDVMEALKGVKLAKWSFFCKDQWAERKNVEWITIPAHVDEFGIQREARIEKRETVAAEAGEQYSIRYQEMQCIENAYLRREISLLKEEIAALKKIVGKK